jgi:hypothetical protein
MIGQVVEADKKCELNTHPSGPVGSISDVEVCTWLLCRSDFNITNSIQISIPQGLKLPLKDYPQPCHHCFFVTNLPGSENSHLI